MDIQLTSPRILPVPRVPITIRPGTIEDIPFLDALQKMHTKQVGWMPTAQFEGKIKLGHVLIAEANSERMGYCIGNDQYFKRDDVGIIYQMNVLPGRQRGFIGASLLTAQFERSAYGCRLYCCWCAQDIDANRFWEACGFVPLAFRTGSRSRGKNATPRVHIFWQKRIREGDHTTPWWFPSQTSSGAIREDRLVLPIPTGVKWNDPMPIILPGQGVSTPQLEDIDPSILVEGKGAPKRRRPPIALAPVTSMGVGDGFLSFAPPAPPKVEKAKREKMPTPKVKNDPPHVAAARELRDRWLEHANANPALIASDGKYDVSRTIADRSAPARLTLLPSRAA